MRYRRKVTRRKTYRKKGRAFAVRQSARRRKFTARRKPEAKSRYPIATAVYKTIGRRIRRRAKLLMKGKTIYRNEKMSMRKAGYLRGKSELRRR